MRAASRLASLFVLAALSLPGVAQGAAPPEFYGVVSQAGLGADDFPRMAENGVGVMRIQLSWKKVQPDEDSCGEGGLPIGLPGDAPCDWAYYDRIFGGAAAAGVELMPYVLSVPDWVSDEENDPPIRTQEDRDAWSAWLAEAAGRYGPGGSFWSDGYPAMHPGAVPLPVRRWQIWNEPSDGTFWHPRPDPGEYGDLVELSSAAIRSVDPAAEIILAGVFGSPNESEGGIRSKRYLRALFKSADLAAAFDSLALHPYGPNLRRSFKQVRTARTVFRRAGFGDRPLWITEIGWASAGNHSQLSKGPAKQAKLLSRAYAKFERKRLKWEIAGVTWFAWQDTGEKNVCGFCASAGLVTIGREAKPALGAFRELALGSG